MKIPYLSNLYTGIDQVYTNILHDFKDETDIDIETLITQSSLDLLKEPQMIINNFFNDISTEYALGESIKRNHEDLVYLISEYLQHYKYFRDFVVYQDEIMVYKYKQLYSLSVIEFEYEKKLRDTTNVIVKFVFDLAMLQAELNKIDTSMYVLYNDTILYSQKIQSLASEDIKKYIKPYQDSDKPQTYANESKGLYINTITENLKYPLTIFIVDKKSDFNIGYLVQFLFILLFPVLFILLIILDQIIYHKIKNLENNKIYNNSLKNMTANNFEDENSLEWIDQWVELEDIVIKDVRAKDTAHINHVNFTKNIKNNKE
ncbi:MAG: hypothetical protein KFW21_06550 [Spirochaetota bacterium]|nr:hypothetical protein [Spirochaetota bacterium]